MKTIYSIVVTYNGMQWIEKCLNSLVDSSYPSHIFVVDNGSNDLTVPFIKNHYPQVEVLESERNLGFGQANNIGLCSALENKADYVFLLNQDAWVETDAILNLVNAHIKNPEFGIISPIHLNGDGSQIDSAFLNYLKESEINEFITSTIFNEERENNLIKTKFVNAAAWLIPINCIKNTGGFNPIFFHYGEDRNYCERTLFWGYKIGIQTNTRIYHDRHNRIKETPLDFDSVLKNKWTKFLKQACNIHNKQYLRFTISTFLHHLIHMSSGLFLFNRKKIAYNFVMARKIIFSILKIINSHKHSVIAGSMPYLRIYSQSLAALKN